MADKTLDTLVRLSRFEVDERQRELQVLLAEEDRIRAGVRALDEEARSEADFSRGHGEGSGSDYGRYLVRIRERRGELSEQLSELQPDIEAARDRLADAFAEQKKYEIAQENRTKEERAEEDRREAQELDELGLNNFRRREAEKNR